MLTGFVLYPSVASLPLRAVGLAAGNRPGLGARLRHLGRRPGQDHGLASVPDAGQLTAAVPDRGHRVERRRGLGVAGAGHLADGDPGRSALAVRGPVVLRLAQPRRREPRDLSRGTGQHEIPPAAAHGRRARVCFHRLRDRPASLHYPASPRRSCTRPCRPRLASYLGVFEVGRAAWLRSDRGFRPGGGRAAEPRRVLQRLGAAVRDVVRQGDLRSRRHPVRADRSHRRLGLGDRRRGLRRRTCACMPTASGTSATPSSSASGTR